MDRAAAVQYLRNRFGTSVESYLDIAGVPIEDSGPIGEIIDTALQRLGAGLADEPVNALGYKAALRYEAYQWLWDNLGRTDRALVFKVSTLSFDPTKYREELPAKIEAARRDAAAQGVTLPAFAESDDGWNGMDPTIGTVGFGLNYL